jgi:hypothetical protein
MRKKPVVKQQVEEVKKPDNIYCRRCKKSLAQSNYYEATDLSIDTNGFMSICKDCINEIYQNYFNLYKSLDKALYYTCRKFDVIYYGEAVNATIVHIETLKSSGKPAEKVFGYYKSKLSSFARINGLSDFTYQDTLFELKREVLEEDLKDIDDDLILNWGKGFSAEDYIFLEHELAEWKETHKCDNKAEITLLREICIKKLDIIRAREGKQPTTSLIKELQELMKTASVDPAKANQANSGKSIDCYGLWIKDVEIKSPAEWIKDKKLFADVDNISDYFKKYITRPLKNFITGSRDFSIDTDFKLEDE